MHQNVVLQKSFGDEEGGGAGGNRNSSIQDSPVLFLKDKSISDKVFRFLQLRAEGKDGTENLDHHFQIEIDPLSDEDFRSFGKQFLTQALQDMQRETATIPYLTILEQTGVSPQLLSRTAEGGDRLIKYCHLIEKMVSRLAHRYPEARLVLDYIEHDQNNILGALAPSCSYLGFDQAEGLKCLQNMKMDNHKDFLYDIYTANLHLMSQGLDLKQVKLGRDLKPGAFLNAKRFVYELKEMDSVQEDVPQENGLIINAVPEDFTIPADKSALMVALFNLEKNPMKIASENGDKVSVMISAEKKNGAAYIYVTDTGKGLNFARLLEKFQEKIREKQKRQEALQEWERKLLEGDATNEKTQSIIKSQLFVRGLSFSESTGNGLAIVKDIVDAHQGHVSIDNFPGAGAIVTIVLPDTEMRDPTIRRRLTQSALIADQLEQLDK